MDKGTGAHVAGLDVSSAVRDFLGLPGNDRVDWQFVDAGQVLDSPWKQIITSSGVCWE